MRVKTSLISGAGNTFHIATDTVETEKWTSSKKKQFAKWVCEKEPADGFIFLKQKSELAWDFFNKDGSDAEMCGNATRCVGLYLSEILKSPQTTWMLKTTAGPIKIEKVEAEEYKVTMTAALEIPSKMGFLVDTGVPHFIQEIKNMRSYPEHKKEAHDLRFHAAFQPRGTNVTYVELLPEKNRLKAVSYERGVEDFTKACGTGAMAAAVYNLKKRGSIETWVEMPGGILKMSLANMQQPVMIGPAKLLGKYEYEEPNR